MPRMVKDITRDTELKTTTFTYVDADGISHKFTKETEDNDAGPSLARWAEEQLNAGPYIFKGGRRYRKTRRTRKSRKSRRTRKSRKSRK